MIEAIKEDNIEELTRLAKKKINKDAKPNFFVVDRPNSQSLITALPDRWTRGNMLPLSIFRQVFCFSIVMDSLLSS